MVRILKKKYFLFLLLIIIITYESVFHLDMRLDRRSSVLAEISGEKCTKHQHNYEKYMSEFLEVCHGDSNLKATKYLTKQG